MQAIMDGASAAYQVDPRRVFTVGHSNGAFFSLHVAMVLRDRVAAFAENAGGLVTCADTADCYFVSTATSCAEMATDANWCTCSADEKPIPIPTSGRVPPAYITHSNDDEVVSIYHSCTLDARLRALGADVTFVVGSQAGGHVIPDTLAADAWAFFAAHPMP